MKEIQGASASQTGLSQVEPQSSQGLAPTGFDPLRVRELLTRLRAPLYWWCGSSPDDERIDIAPIEAAELIEQLLGIPPVSGAIEQARAALLKAHGEQS